MKKYLFSLCAFFLLAIILTGCNDSPISVSTNAEQENSDTTAATAAVVDFSATDADMFTHRDVTPDYTESECVQISLNGNTASATSDSVKISGSTVTVTADAPHIIRGNLENGMLIIDAPDTAKLQLIFDGVTIHSETSAALYIRSADKVFLTLAENSENTLSNGGSFTAIDENNIDGTLFSKQDLTLNGTGTLTVTSPAGHGIVCKDDLVVTGGNYTVNCASHGLDANDSVRLTNAFLTITAGKDGIHAENNDDASLGFVYVSGGNVIVDAQGDGISAGAYAQFESGSFTLTAGGGSENGTKTSSDHYGGFMGGGMGGRPGGMGRPGQQRPSDTSSSEEESTSMKGIKAAGSMLFSGGTFVIDAADDALHADNALTVNGGTFSLASGDDALHAEDALTVTACTMDISQSYEGLEALHIQISGGDIKLIASDDGLNAAGGTDESGFTGGRDGMFGNMGGRPGGMGSMGGNSGGSITVSGGNLYVNASGDGLDANGTLLISGGYTVVVGPTAGDTATLDYDTSAQITGGTFIGTGASGMAQTFSSCAQGVIALQVGNQAAGTDITVTDAAGNTLICYAPELSFQVLILSTPEMVSGETYTVSVGSLSDQFQAN